MLLSGQGPCWRPAASPAELSGSAPGCLGQSPAPALSSRVTWTSTKLCASVSPSVKEVNAQSVLHVYVRIGVDDM